MKEFGWTIEYTLALTFPVFLDLFGLIRRARLDDAIDSFYTPYAAAKYGKECSKELFKGRGDLFLSDDGADAGSAGGPGYTKEQLARANRKLNRIIKKYDSAMIETASKG